MRTDRRDLRAQTASSPADTCHVYHLDQDNDSDFRKRFVSYGRDCWEILVYMSFGGTFEHFVLLS
jgi:hypothetical protein